MSQSDPPERASRVVRRRQGGLLGPLMRRPQSPPSRPEAHVEAVEQVRAAEPEPAGNAPAAWVPDLSAPPEPEESPSPRSEAEETPQRETEDVPAEIAPSTAPAGWQLADANGAAEARSASDSHAAPSELDRSTWVPFEDHHLRHGMPLDNGYHAADEWLPPDERSPARPRDPEVEHRRFRAVSVFCERFCDPAQADAKAAQALELFDTRIRRRPNADEHSANLELLRITRTVAAEAPMLDDHADGWRDKPRSQSCRWGSGGLCPSERAARGARQR